jgi:hypothetical protein
MLRMTQSVLLAGIGAIALAGPSHAADPAYCAQYARLALHELAVNQSIPGCFKGYDLRWNPNYGQHYGWCLGVSAEQAAAERDYRRARLGDCRARAGM